MIYNQEDMSELFSVVQYDGLEAMNLVVSMWTPTQADGERIAHVRRENKTITAHVVVESDANRSLKEKIECLHRVFVPGTEYVSIVFDEQDEKTYKGRVVGFVQNGYYWNFAEYAITFTCLPYRYGGKSSVIGTENAIVGENSGTAPALGEISFDVETGVQNLTISVIGTQGNVQLVANDAEDLAGRWTIDLDKRCVYLNDALAMQYVSFANTEFDAFQIAPGYFEISFSNPVSNATYTYEEVFV